MNWNWVLLLLVVLSAMGVSADMTAQPNVQLPLAPPAENPPYDDEEFFSRVNETVYQITNPKTLPVGKMNNAVYDSLASIYYSLIRMRISPDRYGDAEQDIAFLSYTLTVMELYNDYERNADRFFPVDTSTLTYNDIYQYYSAASDAFKKIASRYPDAEMYAAPPEIEKKTWIIGQIP